MKRILKWLDNYWYHYKWHTLIVAFFVLVIGFCTLQTVRRPEYDAYFLYSGGKYFTADQEQAVLSTLRHVAEDYDGNGSTSLCLKKVIVMSDAELEAARAQAEAEGTQLAYNPEDRATAIEQFEFELMTGNSYLCFLSESMYERCEEKERFIPLSEVVDETPAGAVDEYAVLLSQTEFGDYFSEALSVMGEDVVVCLRRISIADAQSKHATAEYENYKEIFRNLCTFSVK